MVYSLKLGAEEGIFILCFGDCVWHNLTQYCLDSFISKSCMNRLQNAFATTNDIPFLVFSYQERFTLIRFN